jgi:hypothetical protein
MSKQRITYGKTTKTPSYGDAASTPIIHRRYKNLAEKILQEGGGQTPVMVDGKRVGEIVTLFQRDTWSSLETISDGWHVHGYLVRVEHKQIPVYSKVRFPGGYQNRMAKAEARRIVERVIDHLEL